MKIYYDRIFFQIVIINLLIYIMYKYIYLFIYMYKLIESQKKFSFKDLYIKYFVHFRSNYKSNIIRKFNQFSKCW